MTERKDVWLSVVNPYAGSGSTMPLWEKAQKELANLGIPVELRKTGEHGHAEDIAMTAAAEGWRRFMAVGGDGTAHDVLTGIMKYVDSDSSVSLSEFTISVVPVGSGNDWIKSHAIEKDPESVLKLISEDSTVYQDVVRITGPLQKTSYMLNIGGVGFDAGVCAKVNFQKINGKKGKLIYFWALFANLLKHKSIPMEVKVDGKTVFEGKVYTIALGIGEYCGSGMRQCPGALLDDGLLDYTIVPSSIVLSLIPRVLSLYKGNFNETKGLIVGRGKTIEILPLSDATDIVESDGEVVAKLPVKLEIIGQQIKAISKKK